MEDVLKLIRDRQSDRGRFDPERPIERETLDAILEAGRWAPTAHNMQNFEIIIVDDPKILDALGDIKSPVSGDFLRENYRQLSFSREELIKKKTGLLGTMFPPSWKDPAMIEEIIARNEDSTPGRVVQSGSVLLVVVYDPARRAPASEGDFLGIISLGCLMENIWLAANSLGVGVHIVSSLSGDVVEKEVKNLLGIPGNLKIAFSVRLGYPVKPSSDYLRVRRNVSDFTYRNSFGSKY